MSSKGTFRDAFPEEFVQQWATSYISIGDVFRMKLDEREKIIPKNEGDVGRNKFFIISGINTEGDLYGFFVLDTQINPNLPKVRQEKHLKLSSAKYPFMEGQDRYADCSDFKIISKERFVEMFEPDKEKGSIDAIDMSTIREWACSYKNANRSLLREFGIF